MTKTLIAALALTLVSATSFAQTAEPATRGASTPRIDKRESIQSARIQKQEASGQINQTEANRLNRQEQHISNEETRAKADGTVTAAERKHIRRTEDRTSKRINKQGHDGQTAVTPTAAAASK